MQSAAVTGVLGGLGASIAIRLLEQGVKVHGIDLCDPGAAPPPHQAFTLARLRTWPEFTFLAADVRALQPEELLIEGGPPDLLMHCSGIGLSRSGPTPPDLVTDVNLAGTLHTVDVARQAGVSRIMLPQHLPASDNDPRLTDAVGSALLDAEAWVRREVEGMENLLCPSLPMLIGAGQSLRSLPVSQALEALSRIEIRLPTSDQPFPVATLKDAVTFLLDLDYTPPQHGLRAPQMDGRALRPSEMISALFLSLGVRLDQFGTAALQGESDGEHDPGTHPWLYDCIRELAEWLRSLPHLPPADWPDIPARERRAARAAKRRARKRKA